MSLQGVEQSRKTADLYEGLDRMRVVSSLSVVFLHVCSATGVPESMEWLVRLRDFALPVMVMSSFFLLTLSLNRKARSEADFSRFFARRVTRLFLPCFIWTLFYILFTVFFLPLAMGAPPQSEHFSPVVLLTGYRHLWYLQFIFIGSLIVYPLISGKSHNCETSGLRRFVFCTGVGVFYAAFYHLSLRDQIGLILEPEADISLQIFAEQASRYVLFIPLAVGLGFISRSLKELFKIALIRKISMLLAVVAMLLHVKAQNFAWSQEIYGLTVFLAALQPWKKMSFAGWQKLVDYSYGIYILHFFWVHLLWLYIANFNPEINGALVLGAVVIVYSLSFGTAVLIRKVLPADWLLQLAGRKQTESAQRLIRRVSFAVEK